MSNYLFLSADIPELLRFAAGHLALEMLAPREEGGTRKQDPQLQVLPWQRLFYSMLRNRDLEIHSREQLVSINPPRTKLTDHPQLCTLLFPYRHYKKCGDLWRKFYDILMKRHNYKIYDEFEGMDSRPRTLRRFIEFVIIEPIKYDILLNSS